MCDNAVDLPADGQKQNRQLQDASVHTHFHGLAELAVLEHHPQDNSVNKFWREWLGKAFNTELSEVQHHDANGLSDHQDHLQVDDGDIAPSSTCCRSSTRRPTNAC